MQGPEKRAVDDISDLAEAGSECVPTISLITRHLYEDV